MTGRSNNYIKRVFNIFKLIVTVFAVLVIASCPEPMTDDLLAEVEDTVGPVITVTSPDFDVQYFYPSDITITGILTDYSDSGSTIEGSVDSVVCVDLNYKGISLTPDNSVLPTDTHFYLNPDGSFEIFIDTLSLSISGDFTLRITAVDWNGNPTEKELDLFDDVSGPNIGIYDHSPSDYNVYSSVLIGAPLTISGIVEVPTFTFKYEVESGGGPSIGLRDIAYDALSGEFSFPFDPQGEGVSDTLKFIFRADDGLESVVWFYLTDDPDAPELFSADSYTLASDNDALSITLSEGIYTTAAGATGTNIVTTGDFDLTLDGVPLVAPTNWNFSTAPTEGTESLQISIYSGLPVTPDGTEVLTFKPRAGEVFDQVGNPANPIDFLITETLHDKQVPTVSSVTQTDATHLVVVFSEDVNESQAETFTYYSNPAIPTTIPATGAVLSGGNTVTLTFGSVIDSGAGLDITGGVIYDTTVPVPNALATVNGHPIIDGVDPTVSSVDSNRTASTYKEGDVIDITVGFSEIVFVTAGTPTLSLNTGIDAGYISGSGSNTLTFRYTVGANENVTRLDYANTGSLSGTIADTTGNGADLTLPDLTTSDLYIDNLVIDALGPTVSSVDSNRTASTYKEGDVIDIAVGFSEIAVVTAGTPTLSLNTGVSVDYLSGSGTDTFTFRYTVGANENVTRLDYANTGSLSGTIADGVGNPANLPLPNLTSSDLYGDNLVIDALGPTVSSVDSNRTAGAYKEGVVIDIAVEFSEVVVITTGTPSLSLNTGVSVDYFTGSGTNTLTFRYTVGANEDVTRLDYTDTGSLSGTIADGVGNSANLQLPDLASSDLYSDNIEIDNTPPELVSVILVDNGSPGADDGDTITFNFNDEIALGSLVANDTPDDPNTLISNIGIIETESEFAGNEATTSTLVISGNTITITLQGVAADEHGFYMPEGIFTPDSGLTDLAGNPIIVAVNPNEVVVSGSWDETLPTITNVSALPVSLSTGNITVKITYLEPIVTFTEAANITVFNTSNADITNTLDDGSWNSDKTEYTKIYTIGTSATGTSGTVSGTFTVSVNGATDIYGNVQTAPGSNSPVGILVP